MKIAVNTRLLLKGRLEGIGWFMFETLKRITRQHPEHEFYFIFDRAYDESFIFSENIHPVVTFPPARHPLFFYIWFEHIIPRTLKRIKADVFFSPDGYLSLRSKVRSHVVMHDLNFEHYPEDIPYLASKHYRYYFQRYAHKADRIATVSEFSKDDIIKQYQILPEKIDVVYNGASAEFHVLSDVEKEEVKKKYTAGRPYFIFLSALSPRKNLVNLFYAFDQLKQSDNQGLKLLVVGEKMYWTHEIRDTYKQMRYRDEVIFAGRLEFGELTRVLGAALALTYVSYFEGFGIPIVEAFYSGTPVITSNVTSMPEVAGDAAILVDPFSVDSVCQAMQQIAHDGLLRKSMIIKGSERAKLFSWQKSADLLWDSIQKVF
ncbi:MAG: glycosyltransferase family 4 protein [Bacteroidales bacterium]